MCRASSAPWNSHDLRHDRMQFPALAGARPSGCGRSVSSPASTEEERNRQRTGYRGNQRREPAQRSGHTRHVDADAVDHLLEHQGVVALFDGLVGAVPVFGEPLGTQNTWFINPRMRIDSNCRPTLATLACRHWPIAICVPTGCARYQGCRPNTSVSGRIQRSSSAVTANSGASQSMSCRVEVPVAPTLGKGGEQVDIRGVSSRTLHVSPPTPDQLGPCHRQPSIRFHIGRLLSKRYRRYRIPVHGYRATPAGRSISPVPAATSTLVPMPDAAQLIIPPTSSPPTAASAGRRRCGPKQLSA